MNHAALRALEFDRVVEAVRSFALTPFGDARLAGLRPSPDARLVARAIEQTGEMARYLADRPPLTLAAPDGLDASLSALAVAGRALDPLQLRGIADFLASLELTAQGIRTATAVPELTGIVAGIGAFGPEIGEIRRVIQPSGEIVDQASPHLQALRDRLRKHRTRLRSALQSFLRNRDTARYLQDEIVTDRNGRYVLLVKAEHRASIPGIVHGSSTSGSTLFLEPLSTIEINNEVVALEEEEAEEIRRILLALANTLRRRAADLRRAIEAGTELDVLQAMAGFKALTGGVAPQPSSDGRLDLRAARHPLLIGVVNARLGGERAGLGEPVPVDIRLEPPTSALVITGPNTGGKTVALKTAGLLALMAQSGLHVPAETAVLPVFRSVFADIGDEQSIGANLSTFSWHVTNIASMDRHLGLPALVLLDEIGAGTDPAEGGALGTAIIEHFRSRGALVIATTHYDMLKSYASTTDGVTCAAFGFDPESFTPSYRLVYGSPGRSLALEIAKRLGLPEGVITAARSLQSAREAQLAAHLAKVDAQLQDLERERHEAETARRRVKETATEVDRREAALREREETLRRKYDDRFDARLRDARTAIDAVVEDLKRQIGALVMDADQTRRFATMTTGDVGAMRADARQALDRVASGFLGDREAPGGTPSRREPSATRPPQPGDRVRVAGLGLEGVLRARADGHADVEIHGKRLRVPLDELTVSQASEQVTPPAVRVSVPSSAESATDLNVIGCTVDEACARAEKFLDQAALSEARVVRIIHGHGTGRLRRGIGNLLKTHPLVDGFRSEESAQGGGGVTVVDLKD